MVNLSKSIFKPLAILYSVIFPPIIIVMIVAFIFDVRWSARWAYIMVFLLISALYAFAMWNARKESKKDYYLKANDDNVEIRYINLNKDGMDLTPFIISNEDIVAFIYYKMNSFFSWFQLFLPPLGIVYMPKSLFVAYRRNGDVQTKPIGHAEYKEIKEFCEKHNFSLQTH